MQNVSSLVSVQACRSQSCLLVRSIRLKKSSVGSSYRIFSIRFADTCQIKAANSYVVDLDIQQQAAVQVDGGYSYAAKQGRPRPHDRLQTGWRWSLRAPKSPQDEKQWQVVSRKQQLYEANFHEWMQMMEWMLRQLGIWTRLTDRKKYSTNSTRKQAERLVIDDSWAVSVMLMHVKPHFLTLTTRL